jgi:hypothetical protein
VTRRFRACERKSSYPTWEAANVARLRRVETGLIPAGLLHVYPCRYGSHFHLGHIARRIRQQAMRKVG